MQHCNPPNGYFSRGLIVFDDLATGGSVAKGFRIAAPDLRGASEQYCEAVHDRLTRFLAGLGPEHRLQFQWRCTSDYRDVLAAYDAVTAKATNPVERRKREERSALYHQRLASRQLRREELVIFIGTNVRGSAPLLKTPAGLAEHNDAILDNLSRAYDQHLAQLRSNMGTEVIVEPMDDFDHFVYFWRFLNPSANERTSIPFEELFNPEASIQDNCWNGDIVGKAKHGFFLDSRHHNILSLKRLGRHTYQGIATHLTGLTLLDYQITVIVEPIDIEKEIKAEEHETSKLQAEQKEKYSESKEVAIEKKKTKVRKLAHGHTRAFQVTYLVRIWGDTEAALSTASDSLKSAFNEMKGAQAYEDSLPAGALKLFYATWPGWCFSSYRGRQNYMEDETLADILPFSSSFHGDLKGAEALYEGTNRNLVGVSAFAKGKIPTPQHTTLIGMSGSGKSEFVQDLMHQSGPYYSYDVIIEEGNSHSDYVKAHGCKSLVITPESQYCINYFDTGGNPLARLHTSFAISLLTHMTGRTDDDRLREKRKSQLSRYVNEQYSNAHIDWSKKNPAAYQEVKREALGKTEWLRTRMSGDDTLTDAWGVIREGIANNNGEILEFLARLNEDDIVRFAKDAKTERIVMEHAFSRMKKEDFPQHSALVEGMRFARMSDHDAGEINEIADLLQNWTAESGQYGGLFDGVSNVNLTGRVVHFELASIPEGMPELKSAIALLITGFVRQCIISRPRAEWKRVIFEELARFLTVPDAGKLVEECYAQFRKYNTWVLSIIQQYGKFKDTPIRPVIMGNSKQFFFMRQFDKDDRASIVEATQLPASMDQAISNYKLVEHQDANDLHSSVCYYNPGAYPPISGTLRHYRPPTIPSTK